MLLGLPHALNVSLPLSAPRMTRLTGRKTVVLYRRRAGARIQRSRAKWIAGSHSIQPFEVSRNGIVQLWGLKADHTGEVGRRPSADDQPGLAIQVISRHRRPVTSMVLRFTGRTNTRQPMPSRPADY